MESLTAFDSVDRAFAVEGEPMRLHRGRSVVRVQVDGAWCYLKRFWWTPSQTLRRFVSQGLHELAMIDWLNSHGFCGPNVIARGVQRRFGFNYRMYFVMREADGELPLERYYRRNRESAGTLIDALAAHTARLHEAGFYHHDYSERHLLVGQSTEGLHFRQIDLERARQGQRNEKTAAADIKTLITSIADETLAEKIETDMVSRYITNRRTAPDLATFRALLRTAQATKTFE